MKRKWRTARIFSIVLIAALVLGQVAMSFATTTDLDSAENTVPQNLENEAPASGSDEDGTQAKTPANVPATVQNKAQTKAAAEEGSVDQGNDATEDTYTITFKGNGNTEGTAPESMTVKAGDTVTMPEQGTLQKSGLVFSGWSESSTANGNGQQNYTKKVYPAGSATYTMPAKNVTLYAIWSQENVDAEFYIRLDGTIPTEPQAHPSSEYTGAIKIEGAIKVGSFYTNSTSGVEGKLNGTPTEQQITDALTAKGKTYDPTKQYVLWYVIKHENSWHVDGVLLDIEKVNLSYNANAPEGTWTGMPDGQQYDKDATATVSDKIPTREGYKFTGWNTVADGSGTAYSGKDTFTITKETTLYAQWEQRADAFRVSGYEGIYDGRSHTITTSGTLDQKTGETWQYSADNKNWSGTLPDYTDVADATVYARVVNGSGTVAWQGSTTVKITPRSITLTSETASKTYDGTPLTNNTVTVSGNGFVEGEGATYNVTGSQTNAGSSDNTFTYALNEGTKADNYTITKTEGTITVTPAPVTVSADNKTKTAGNDDPQLTATVSGLVNNEPISNITYSLSRATGEAAGSYLITPSGEATQGNYAVTYVPGTLTITAAPTPTPTPTPPVGPTGPTVTPRTPVGGGVTPVAGIGGGTAPLATATINDTASPLATIDDEATPKAAMDNHWALLNLLLTIFTAALAVILIVLYFTKKRREEEEEDQQQASAAAQSDEDDRTIKRRGVPRILSGIWAIAMIIVFFLTEDMSLPMQFTDNWTWLMVIMAIMQVVIAVVCKKQYDEADQEPIEA